ncbi:5'/3'-nucleotidase SurE [Azomonas macrocytogenes]|uniref:5'-nucleotidase SurE n=1 Tax=Azomonas macrocytogenes TaxID=69962 RepID=A0A839T0Z4_AZOMA|nr:5'/3'-nucleotidase SurE [Azomonas macrocytogenes]MBB3102176.1 5'-nucleotidase [Azomonas macrocytogenes]
MPKAGQIFERVLLTNDDGFDAPGLRVLEQVAATLAREVWVVAPEHDQSGTSHSLSLHDSLRVSRKSERRFAVRGTPGDCVVLGVRHLMSGGLPEMIFSGVNRGANLGVETVFSGTVGAAMTGMLLGVPSIALSQAFSDRNAVPWETARTLAPEIIRRLSVMDWQRNTCLNINFPDCPADRTGPLTLTCQGAGLLDGVDVVSRSDPRAIDYHWLQLSRSLRQDAEGTEAAAVAAGCISVTPLRFERTHAEALAEMRMALASTE